MKDAKPESRKIYDVTFVLPPYTLGYPPGGYDIVYRLANALNKKNIKTSIIFFIHSNGYIENQMESTKNIRKILRSIFTFIFYGSKIKIFYKVWNHVKNIFKIDYDYKILDNVDLYLYNKIEDVQFSTNIIFATAWETAYFVQKFIKKSTSKPCYLVQHSEDDVSFSGKNSLLAKKTYDFNFKKFVINQKVYNRFKNEEPYFFHVGIDTTFYKSTKEFNKRDGILFPLRKSESKGPEYAFECIEKLLKNNINITIRAFGDFKKSEIPDNLKGKIQYYYRPTRKFLRKLYNMSSIFVLPSIVEGMSLPPLEAMACGSAVIVTDNGGVNEYIKDGFNGLICPVKDSQCLYDKIIYLLNNNNKLIELTKNGNDTAIQYSYEKMEKKFIDLLINYKIINS